MRWISILFMIGAVAFAVFQARELIDQFVLNQATTQVQGIVTRSDAQSPRHRAHGRVWITFTYEYNGARYESERIYAADCILLMEGPKYQELAARFAAGSTVSVWVSDRAPEKGFLLKCSRAEPFAFFLLACMAVVGFGVGALPQARKMSLTPVRGVTPALWELRSASSVRARWLTKLIGGGVLLAFTLFVGIYGWVSVPQEDRNKLWLLLPAALASLCGAGYTLVSGGGLWYSRHAASMRVMVDRVRARRGEPLRIVVERSVRKSAAVQAVDVTLRCDRPVGKKYELLWSKTAQVMDAEKISAAKRDVVRAVATFVVPVEMPPTNDDEDGQPAMWSVYVHTHAKGPDPSESWEIAVD